MAKVFERNVYEFNMANLNKYAWLIIKKNQLQIEFLTKNRKFL